MTLRDKPKKLTNIENIVLKSIAKEGFSIEEGVTTYACLDSIKLQALGPKIEDDDKLELFTETDMYFDAYCLSGAKLLSVSGLILYLVHVV